MSDAIEHRSPDRAWPGAGARLSRTDLLVVLGMLLAWAAFFVAKGTAVAAYHLDDDHEILRLTADLRGGSFLEVARTWLGGDSRFRPVYYLHRIVEAWAFGDDFRAWGIYTTSLGAATFALLYAATRWLRFPAMAALAFAFFGLCGDQLAIWWRTGPNETVGMACLALGLLGLARWSLTGAVGWRALFWIGALLASLSKESFVALLPALVLAAPCCLVAQRGLRWRDALRTCAPEALLLGCAAVAEALVIVLVFGTEQMGYAGVRGVTPQLVAVAASRLLGAGEAVTLAALGAVWWLAGRPGRPPVSRALAPTVVLALLAIGLQAFVYAKAGMYERYRVPGALAVSLLLACAVRGALGAARAARAPAGGQAVGWTRHRRAIAAGACLLALVPLGTRRVRPMVTDAARYARAGRETQALLDAVVRLPPGSRVVVVGGHQGAGEGFWSVNTYLGLRAPGLAVSYRLMQLDGPVSPFQQQLRERFAAQTALTRFRPEAGDPPPDAVAVFPREERRFLRQEAGWFDLAAHDRAPLPSSFALYLRRGAAPR